MPMHRRHVLMAAGAVALGRVARATPATSSSTAGSGDWASVRALFTLDPRRVHLSSFLLASHPSPVRDAIERHRRGLDADPVGYVHRHHNPLEARSRAAAARYLDVKPAEIVLTHSTTMGLGLVYAGLRLHPGDEVLTTEHDHTSTHDALTMACTRTGAILRKVRLYERGAPLDVHAIVEAITGAWTPRTRVVALTWVHSSTGVKLPLKEIARALDVLRGGRGPAERALLCVDAVHGLGVEDETPASLGCDVFIAGTHKSLHGPRGTGIVWVKPHARERLAPLIPSFTEEQGWGGEMTPGGFHSFEHRWALAEAFDLHREIGRARISERIHQLVRRLKDGLTSIPRVAMVTPTDDALSASLVAFDVRDLRAGEVVRRLRARGIVASVAPYREPAVRLAPAVFNNEADIDRALEALAAL